MAKREEPATIAFLAEHGVTAPVRGVDLELSLGTDRRSTDGCLWHSDRRDSLRDAEITPVQTKWALTPSVLGQALATGDQFQRLGATVRPCVALVGDVPHPVLADIAGEAPFSTSVNVQVRPGLFAGVAASNRYSGIAPWKTRDVRTWLGDLAASAEVRVGLWPEATQHFTVCAIVDLGPDGTLLLASHRPDLSGRARTLGMSTIGRALAGWVRFHRDLPSPVRVATLAMEPGGLFPELARARALIPLNAQECGNLRAALKIVLSLPPMASAEY